MLDSGVTETSGTVVSAEADPSAPAVPVAPLVEVVAGSGGPTAVLTARGVERVVQAVKEGDQTPAEGVVDVARGVAPVAPSEHEPPQAGTAEISPLAGQEEGTPEAERVEDSAVPVQPEEEKEKKQAKTAAELAQEEEQRIQTNAQRDKEAIILARFGKSPTDKQKEQIEEIFRNATPADLEALHERLLKFPAERNLNYDTKTEKRVESLLGRVAKQMKKEASPREIAIQQIMVLIASNNELKALEKKFPKRTLLLLIAQILVAGLIAIVPQLKTVFQSR